jgi:DNA primase
MTPLELIEKHKFHYVVQGNDLLIKCLNPDHEDSNPSMRIDRVSGIFHCFACGYKGNILDRFNVQRSKTHIKRLTLKEKIIKHLAENNGLQMPASAEYWDVSYRNISAETYQNFNAFMHSNFENRIVFPIYDVTGKIAVFQARALGDESPKYLFYPRHVQPPIYPLPFKPVLGSVVLVEGIFDVLNLWDKGIKNVVTCFGTQSVTEDKLKLLHMLGVSKIYVFFDGDNAGQNSSAKLEKLIISCGFEYENIYYEDKDPGELSAQSIERLKLKLWPEYY